MRTQNEIVARFNAKSKEIMNFEPEVLFEFLDFEHAKPFLKEGITEKDWETIPYDKETVLTQAKEYMEEYGWPKCQDHRGLSASRTLTKMQAWTWLLGEDELVEKISKMEKTNYSQYGAPILKVICEHFGWPIPDDEATQRMMEGLPCTPDCNMGCGR